MAKVLGLGGGFVKAQNPQGVEIAGAQLWSEGRSCSVWSAFDAATTDFEPSGRERSKTTAADPEGTLIERWQPAA